MLFQGVVSSIVDFVQGNTPIPQEDTHWFSESGLINAFFLLGPGPKDVMYQYAKLTGVTPLPPVSFKFFISILFYGVLKYCYIVLDCYKNDEKW